MLICKKAIVHGKVVKIGSIALGLHWTSLHYITRVIAFIAIKLIFSTVVIFINFMNYHASIAFFLFVFAFDNVNLSLNRWLCLQWISIVKVIMFDYFEFINANEKYIFVNLSQISSIHTLQLQYRWLWACLFGYNQTKIKLIFSSSFSRHFDILALFRLHSGSQTLSLLLTAKLNTIRLTWVFLHSNLTVTFI